MSIVNVGIIGLGNMGSSHAIKLVENPVKGAKLAAVCDENQDRMEWAKTRWPYAKASKSIL